MSDSMSFRLYARLQEQQRELDKLEGAVAHDAGLTRAAFTQLQEQVLQLSMTVVVMAQILEESGHLNVEQLQARLEAEMERIRPTRAPVPANPVKQAPSAAPVECAKCGSVVPQSKTTITEAGTVCDRCAV